MFTEIQCATAMGKPAHDEFVTTGDLLAVDTQVLTFFMRAFGNHQTPSQQRRDITRPAMLNRQTCQIDVVALPDNILTGRRAQLARCHVPN